MRTWTQLAVTVCLLIGSCLPAVPPRKLPVSRAPVRAAPSAVHDPLLRDPADSASCYVDVIGRPEIATAGELGAFLRLIPEGQKHEVAIVHPVRAALIVSHRDGCYLFTFEYRDDAQTDPATPSRGVLLPFLGVAKGLFADGEPLFAFQIGLLVAWTTGAGPAANDDR